MVAQAAGKEAEEDGAEGGGDAPDIVTEAGAGGAQEGGKERGQVHGEESEAALAKADKREPAEQGGMVARDAIGPEQDQEVAQEHRGDGRAVTQTAGEPGGEEIAEDGGADDHSTWPGWPVCSLFRSPGQDLGQVAQVLLVPEQEGPVGGEGDAADQDDPKGHAPDFAAEQFADSRLVVLGVLPGPGAIPRVRARPGGPRTRAKPGGSRPGTGIAGERLPGR